MTARGATRPPPTVSASIHVEYLRPTRMSPLKIEAKVTETSGRKVAVRSRLESAGEVTATLEGTFVEVGHGHPAADRW